MPRCLRDERRHGRAQCISARSQLVSAGKGSKGGHCHKFTEATRPTPRTVAGCGEDEKTISKEELEAIYGQPNKVNIYTGEITHVGEKHIEYDVISFTSCSGAIVLLLDKGQPESVDPNLDHGKAVAIHAGAHPFVNDRNLGFKLRGNVASVGPELIDCIPTTMLFCQGVINL